MEWSVAGLNSGMAMASRGGCLDSRDQTKGINSSKMPPLLGKHETEGFLVVCCVYLTG
jgi:hypothetical protein